MSMDAAPPGQDPSGSSSLLASSAAQAAAQVVAAQASSPSPAFRTGKHKSCDACKARKVKCPNANYPAPCGNCVRRKTTCHFGTKKVPRRNVSAHLQLGRPCTASGVLHDATLDGVSDATHSPDASPLRYVNPPQPAKPGDAESEASGAHTPAASQTDVYGHNGIIRADVDTIPMLYIDHMLARAQHQTLGKEYTPLTKGNGIFGKSSVAPVFASVSSTPSAPLSSPQDPSPNRQSAGGSYSLTFFSESRLLSLSSRLRNNKVSELVHRINGVIVGRLRRTEPTAQEPLMMPITPMTTDGTGVGDGSPAVPLVDPPFAAACVRSYFDNVHTQYPFLDQANFERRAADGDLARSLANSRAWSSLYHAVLAIGCLYTDGGSNGNGSFEPGKGASWRLFSVALGHFSELLILPDSLITLQALTAMAIYGLGVACLSIERVLLSEAARRAQSLAAASSSSSSSSIGGLPTGVNPASSATFQRTFWVLYGIEKVMSFHFGRSSSFVDSDISCPLPAIPVAPLDDDDDGGDGPDGSVSGHQEMHQPTPPHQHHQPKQVQHLDWFLIWIRHARLLSRTYTSLFSVGTSCNSAASSLATIDQLAFEVEEWRRSIPDVRSLRPQTGPAAGQVSHRRQRHRTATTSAHGSRDFEQSTTLTLSFLYHSYALILARARLHHLARLTGSHVMTPAQQMQQQTASEQVITSSCRAILELTPFIEIESYTPLWILAVAPLSSLLVLFDFVIHHPTAPDAASNLVLLDMGAGYFSRIEYTSGGTLPGSLVSEFVHIARDYVNGRQHYGAASGEASVTAQQPLPIPPPPPSMSSPALHDASATSPSQPLGLVDPSAMTNVDWSAVTVAAASVPPSSSGTLVGPGAVPGYSDSFGYGYLGAGTATGDFSGTDVMGLFSYLLPEMDSMLYQGLADQGMADQGFES